ncbi:MAG: PEP-CTERM sorting domain-containing protein [Pirellulales bacterium]
MLVTKRWNSVLIGLALHFSLTAAPVHAAVTYTFSGTIDLSEVAGINAGDTFSGSFTYDLATPTSGAPYALPTGFGQDYQSSVATPANALEFQVNAFTFSAPAPTLHYTVYDQLPNPGLWIDLFSMSSNFTTLFFQNEDGTAFSSTALPASVPSLSAFDYARLFGYDENFNYYQGTITALTPLAVPEPSSILLAAIGLMGLVAFGRRLR